METNTDIKIETKKSLPFLLLVSFISFWRPDLNVFLAMNIFAGGILVVDYLFTTEKYNNYTKHFKPDYYKNKIKKKSEKI